MNEITLINNTGIQYYQTKEITIDLNANIMKSLKFYEFQIKDKVFLDPAYYFPMKDKYLRRGDLQSAGYLNPSTNEIAPEEVINPNMNWLDVSNLLSVGRLNVTIGDKKLSALEQIENQWLPMPYYANDITGNTRTPSSWCRIKLCPVTEKCSNTQKVYKVVMAFDTTEDRTNGTNSPHFQGEPFKKFSLCGLANEDLEALPDSKRKTAISKLLPLLAYEFCNPAKQPWLIPYIQDILNSTNLEALPVGSKLKHLAYYTYLICYLHQINVLPEVKLYNDCGTGSIKTNIVLDVGNSRTFGLVAEDPLDLSFSKAEVLQLRDLETGDIYDKPFDMRLCFKEERFGLNSGPNQFKWPSIVRLGTEAFRNIYEGDQDLLNVNQFDTSYSSPKRYLWDDQPFEGQWKFISEKNRVVGPSQTVSLEGLMQQFHNDGSFSADPHEMGERSSYSRSSLMTFCFIEILLQVRMQINSYAFRTNNGNENCKREIGRVIVTCPTAMPRSEQIVLRRCMQEATIVLNRFYSKTYNIPYEPEKDNNKVEIIPSVRDLKLSIDNIDMRRCWNYDEATCCQMVYMYSELRRFLGNTGEFFSLYGKCINKERKPSLTIASLDIGAGTSDIMICNYKETGESILPTPLFWESFHLAGDDLIKRIIKDVILEGPVDKYPEASGIITAKLRSINCSDIPNTMHHFFDDTSNMGVIEKRMRKEFCVQVLIPIANFLLYKLQNADDGTAYTYKDIFCHHHPSQCLMDFFAKHFQFRFEDLVIRLSKEYMNEIIRRVFEPIMRKWSAIFYSYKCDIVLLGGRPCSLQQVHSLIKRLLAVTPDRLISMNNYRVGSWYPGASDIGKFGDRKSLVAVGALISYLAENGKLSAFKMSSQNLKTKVVPTSEYIGILNPQTGVMENILTPDLNGNTMEISAFPIHLGTKQIDVLGYPARHMYILDFDEKRIRAQAIEYLKQQLGLPSDVPESKISPDYINNEIETIKFRAKKDSPLHFRIEREYYEDKELVKIDTVENSQRDDVPNVFMLKEQSWAEDESNWLDTGIFTLHIAY